MNIRRKITNLTALTLFIIIFIAATVFASIFLFYDRNLKLQELSSQNINFSELAEQKYSSIEEMIGAPLFLNFAKEFEEISGLKIAIIDASNNIVINPLNLSEENAKRIIESEGMLRIRIFSAIPVVLEKSEKIIQLNVVNDSYYVSVKSFNLGNKQFFSAFFKPDTEFEVPPFRYFFAVIFLLFTAIFISYIAGIFLGKSLSGNILKLNAYVKRIAAGNYGEKIMINSEDEIEILADNINLMKEKIKISQDSLKEFTSMVSHEIKNMLTVIQGYSEALKAGVYTTQEKKLGALNIIISKSRDLENLTDSLLVLSKVENKIVEIKNDEINPSELIDELVDFYENQISSHNLKIIKKINTGKDTFIKTDKYLLQTILSNLINNAIKYSQQGSTIEVGLKSVVLKSNILSKTGIFKIKQELEIIKTEVEFYVINEGLEISKEEKEKIFKIFYRGNKAQDYKIEGYGLGLAISTKIAGFLNAQLDFTSRGKQNIFSLKFLP